MNRFQTVSGNDPNDFYVPVGSMCCNVLKLQHSFLYSSSAFVSPCMSRTFEQVSDVGLFLFNDALVLTLRNIHHTPFTLAHRCTHTFLASVALTSLAVREITHTRCTSCPIYRMLLQFWYFGAIFEIYSDTNVCLCRCVPRLCPGGALSFLGLCHRQR